MSTSFLPSVPLLAGAALIALLTLAPGSSASLSALEPGVSSPPSVPIRSYFIAIDDLGSWTRSAGEKESETALTSPLINAPLSWNELVVSWNAQLPPGAYLRVEARACYDEAAGRNATKFYTLGHWSMDAARHSVNGQTDAEGDVKTDTLVLKRRGAQLQIRLTVGQSDKSVEADAANAVRFIGLSLVDNTIATGEAVSSVLTAAKPAAWGKTIAVPERFQGDFREQGGAVWCSPTTLSMILEYWSETLARPELDMTVPAVAGAVHDPQWPGTGNWPFNTAFAGSFPGMRAYVTRLRDLSEVEAWIAAGVPVALSVEYGLLKGQGNKDSGHLVLCNGFTATGDVVIADPGRRPLAGERYRVFPRRDVAAAWASSQNTVYLVYPESMQPPAASPNWPGQ